MAAPAPVGGGGGGPPVQQVVLPQTRARLTNVQVKETANRVQQAYADALALPDATARDAALLAMRGSHEYKNLTGVLTGEIIVPERLLKGTIAHIEGLDVVKDIRQHSPQVEQMKQMQVIQQHVADSTYCHQDLSTSKDADPYSPDLEKQPKLGEFARNRGVPGAVIFEDGTSTATVDDKLTVDLITIRPPNGSLDPLKFKVVVKVPPGKEKLFHGVKDETFECDTAEEATAKFDTILKKAGAKPAKKALKEAEKVRAESFDLARHSWEARFKNFQTFKSKEEAQAKVAAMPAPGTVLYIPWRRAALPPQYYISVHKAGEDEVQTFEIEVTAIPPHMWKDHSPVRVKLAPDRSEELPITEGEKEQSQELSRIFGMLAVRAAEDYSPPVL